MENVKKIFYILNIPSLKFRGSFSLLIGLCLAVCSPVMALSPNLKPYSNNPYYWEYKSEPVLLLGGSSEDNLFQLPSAKLKIELDRLREHGGNYVRNTMSSRDEGNVWPFEINNGKYDLRSWNSVYWDRFEHFLEETSNRGIFVQLELWATFDYYRDNWFNKNPFNPRNNQTYDLDMSGLSESVVTHPALHQNSFFYSVPKEDELKIVLKYQERFVEKILSYSLRFDHVLYCIDNETAVTPEWGRYWSKFIRNQSDLANREIYITEMWNEWDLRDGQHRETRENITDYDFIEVSQNNHQSGQDHFDALAWVRDQLALMPRPMNSVKVYGGKKKKEDTSQEGSERFWRNLFAGVAAIRFHRPKSGLGDTDLALMHLRGARRFTDTFEFYKSYPAPDRLERRHDDEAYCLEIPGKKWAVYFPPVEALNYWERILSFLLDDLSSEREVILDLFEEPKKISIKWFSIEKSEFLKTNIYYSQQVEMLTPDDSQWIAIVELL